MAKATRVAPEIIEKKESEITNLSTDTLPPKEDLVEKKEEEEKPLIIPVAVESPKEEDATPVYRAETDATLSREERLVAFLKNRPTGEFIKINDFLKSTFQVTKPPAPPEWVQQGVSKTLRVALEKLQADGKIIINNNLHKRLGTHYYDSDVDPVTKYWNIGTLPIEAKAV